MTNEQKIAVLKRARTILARPKGWVKDYFETEVPGKDYNAYCLGGACGQAAHELGLNTKWAAHSSTVANNLSVRKLAQEKGFPGVAAFNDDPDTRKKDVLALVDERIAQLEKA